MCGHSNMQVEDKVTLAQLLNRFKIYHCPLGGALQMYKSRAGQFTVYYYQTRQNTVIISSVFLKQENNQLNLNVPLSARKWRNVLF